MQQRYSATNQLLHWLTAGCVFAMLPIAWLMMNVAPQAPGREALFNWHKTLGGVVLLLTLFRIAWRWKDGPPPYPARVARWDRRLAHGVYLLFFATLIWMTVTGEMLTLYDTHQTVVFNLIPTPQILKPDKAACQVFVQLHRAGQWAVYALLLLHGAGVLVHVVWGRDGVLGRMLPASATEPPSA